MYTTADNATAMISLNKAEHSTSIYTTFVVSNTRILPTTAYKILFLISSTSKKRFLFGALRVQKTNTNSSDNNVVNAAPYRLCQALRLKRNN